VPTRPSATHSGAVPPIGAPRFLRPAEVEALYGLTRKFLAHARGRGDGPPFSKAGRKVVLYKVTDVEEWLAARRRLSTADPGPVE
jgi:hypothetical protein